MAICRLRLIITSGTGEVAELGWFGGDPRGHQGLARCWSSSPSCRSCIPKTFSTTIVATIGRCYRNPASDNQCSRPGPEGIDGPRAGNCRPDMNGRRRPTFTAILAYNTLVDFASFAPKAFAFPASRSSRSAQCRNTLEITSIAVISRSKGGFIPIRAAEAQSTLFQTRLASPGRIAPCSTQKSWRLALGRLPRVSKIAQRLTFFCTPRKSWTSAAKGEHF